jgi:hypothetical protein
MKVVLGILVAILFALSAHAEVLVLKDNYYIANVRIIGTDGDKTIYRWAEKLFEIETNLIVEISKELPKQGIIADPNRFDSSFVSQTVAAQGSTSSAVKTTSEKIKKEIEIPQRLQIENGFWGYSYMYDGDAIKREAAMVLLNEVPAALALHGQADKGYAWSNVLGGVGAAMIGWPLGQWAAGQRYPSWGLAAIGTALVLPSIVGANHANMNYRKAMKLYNEKMVEKKEAPKEEGAWEMKLLPWNVKLSYHF